MRQLIPLALRLWRRVNRGRDGQMRFHVDREGSEPPWHTNYNTGLPCTCDNKGGDR